LFTSLAETDRNEQQSVNIKNTLRMKKNYLLIIVLSLSIQICLEAQKLPVINQFQYSRLFYNPGYAGSNERFNAMVMVRKQWVNTDGSPSLGLLSFDSPIKKSNIALGGTFSNDHIGVTNQMDVALNGSYKLKLNNETFLNLGMKLGVSYYKSNLTSLNLYDPNDQVFLSNIDGAALPRVGFGAYLHSINYYAGFSAPDLITYDANNVFARSGKTSTLKRNYVAMGGLYLNLSNKIKFIPSAMIKYFPNTPVSVSLSAGLKLSDNIQAGIAYRTPQTVSFFGQFFLSDRIRLGTAYELPLSRVNAWGSVEVLLSYGVLQ
jgi:type IX secretion system PorP/SprF family membrane protein